MFSIFDGFKSGIEDFGTAVDHLPPHGLDHDGGWDAMHPPDMDHFEVFDPWAEADHGSHPDGWHPAGIGDPSGDGFTAQTTAFTCNLVSQKMILDQFHITNPSTGQPISEAQLVYDATVHGWLTEHGTSIPDMGRLLEYYGVPCHHGNGFEAMLREVAAGHQVIVAVNADELWTPDWHAVTAHGPNHALVLKGVKADGHGGIVAVLNDPGQPHGAGVEYPFDQFRAACDDGHFHYVATDHAPPDWVPTANSPTFAPTPAGGADPHEYSHPDAFADFVLHLPPREKHEFLRNL
jgi:hypothetical protein